MEENTGWFSNSMNKLAISSKDAFSIHNVFKRLFLIFFFGAILGLKQLIQNIDQVGKTGGGLFRYLWAIIMAEKSGIGVALNSVWSVVLNLGTYFQSNYWGSIVFTVLMFVLLMGVFFQPVSFIMNIFDGKKGQESSFVIRGIVTLIIILIASCLVFYSTGGEALVTNVNNITVLPGMNETITAVNGTAVINLLATNISGVNQSGT